MIASAEGSVCSVPRHVRRQSELSGSSRVPYREGQCVAAGDGGHVDDLAGLSLKCQVKAELRQERLQRSPQHAFSAHADPMSLQPLRQHACWCVQGERLL